MCIIFIVFPLQNTVEDVKSSYFSCLNFELFPLEAEFISGTEKLHNKYMQLGVH